MIQSIILELFIKHETASVIIYDTLSQSLSIVISISQYDQPVCSTRPETRNRKVTTW